MSYIWESFHKPPLNDFQDWGHVTSLLQDVHEMSSLKTSPEPAAETQNSAHLLMWNHFSLVLLFCTLSSHLWKLWRFANAGRVISWQNGSCDVFCPACLRDSSVLCIRMPLPQKKASLWFLTEFLGILTMSSHLHSFINTISDNYHPETC